MSDSAQEESKRHEGSGEQQQQQGEEESTRTTDQTSSGYIQAKSAYEALSAHLSRSSTPAQQQADKEASAAPHRAAFFRSASVPTLENTPPKLCVRWLFAEGKTWTPFGIGDSTHLEEGWKQWQKEKDNVVDESGEDDKEEEKAAASSSNAKSQSRKSSSASNKKGKGKAEEEYAKLPEADPTQPLPCWRVSVGEDRMFEVDVRPPRKPAMWPVHWKTTTPTDVRRATWFFESSKITPCESALAEELSELYETIQPWTSAYAEELKASASIGAEGEEKLKCRIKTLYGSYVIFLGPHLARIYQEGVSTRLTKTFLTAWSGEHGGGSLVVRGYDQMRRLNKARIGDTSSQHKRKKSNPMSRVSSVAMEQNPSQQSESHERTPSRDRKRDSMDSARDSVEIPRGAADTPSGSKDAQSSSAVPTTQAENQKQADLWGSLTSKLGSWATPSAATIAGNTGLSSRAQKDVSDSFKEAQRRMQDLPENIDSKLEGEEGQDENEEEEEWAKERAHESEEVELVICWHGIGQKMAESYSQLEFSTAVNAFKNLTRKRARASPPPFVGGPGMAELTKGKRLAFIPINWRATLHDFRPDKEEEDVDAEEDEHLDNQVDLEDIFGTDDSIPFARQIIKNLLLDIPFYLSHHRGEILRRCIVETNRAYAVFCQRNPEFRRKSGKVSMIAHSLGCVLSVDILSAQPTAIKAGEDDLSLQDIVKSDALAFNTRSLYLCGSPSALFFYLRNYQLIARKGRELTRDSSGEGENAVKKDQALDRRLWGCLSVDRIYNVFNSTDPIGTCLNGCVDSRFAKQMPAVPVDKTVSCILATLPGSTGQKLAAANAAAGAKSSGGVAAAGASVSSAASSSLNWMGNWYGGGSASKASEEVDAPDLEEPNKVTGGSVEEQVVKSQSATQRQSWADKWAKRKAAAADGDGDGESKVGEHAETEDGKEKASDGTEADGHTYPPQAGKVAEEAEENSKAEGAPDVQGQTRDDNYDPSSTIMEEDHVAAAASLSEKQRQEGEALKAGLQVNPEPVPQVPPRPKKKGDQDKADRGDGGKGSATTATRASKSKRSQEAAAALGPAKAATSPAHDRATRRFLSLNPMGRIDYVLPKQPGTFSSFGPPSAVQMLEYVGMLQAHASYFTNADFADLILATSAIGDGRLEGRPSSSSSSEVDEEAEGEEPEEEDDMTSRERWQRVRRMLFGEEDVPSLLAPPK